MAFAMQLSLQQRLSKQRSSSEDRATEKLIKQMLEIEQIHHMMTAGVGGPQMVNEEDDREIARMLQEEMNYSPKPRPEDQKFECEICTDKFTVDGMLLLTNCDHIYHQDCMRNYVKAEIEA